MRRSVWTLAFCLLATCAEAQPPRYEWEGVERLVVVGDLHGQYGQMLTLLTGAGLIDDELAWIGGKQHLIFCGDLIDRGPDDRAVLDLARKLQPEAEAAGGWVHVLLGNHEVMNLTRDFRYVSAESFADFAGEESSGERKRGFQEFRKQMSQRGVGPSQIQAAFDQRYPPGYFAWQRAFAPEGEYGSWLMRQPTVIKVNGLLFVHGGLTEEVAALGLDEINRRMREQILAFVDNGGKLEDEADWPAAFGDLLEAARDIAGGSGRKASGALGEAARRLLAAHEGLPFTTDGPVWYRGSSVENERIELQRLDRVLSLLGARGEVVGHTVTRTGQISSRFNGRLYRSDVGMGYGRKARALLLADGTPRMLDPVSGSLTPPYVEPPQGEGWPAGEEELPDEVLESFLATARISSISSSDFGVVVRILELEGDGMHLRAIHGSTSETAAQAAAAGRRAPRRFQHTVAAYRIDRLMRLNLVPVTVLRRVEGVDGLIQIWIQGAMDQSVIEEYDSWELLRGLETQVAEAAAFSGLIGNEERIPAGRMLLPHSKRILLADNSVSFYEDPDIRSYMPEGCGPVGPMFMAALRTLDRKRLRQALGDLLSDGAIDALLARRAGLIELCENPDPDWSVEKIIRRISTRPQTG